MRVARLTKKKMEISRLSKLSVLRVPRRQNAVPIAPRQVHAAQMGVVDFFELPEHLGPRLTRWYPDIQLHKEPSYSTESQQD